MRIIDSLKERFARRQAGNVTIVSRPGAVPPEDKRSLARRILDAPADFNRATRRSVGLTGRLWRWDINGTEMQRAYVPRYIRRHYARMQANIVYVPGYAKRWPRAARRERARMSRIITAKGLA